MCEEGVGRKGEKGGRRRGERGEGRWEMEDRRWEMGEGRGERGEGEKRGKGEGEKIKEEKRKYMLQLFNFFLNNKTLFFLLCFSFHLVLLVNIIIITLQLDSKIE